MRSGRQGNGVGRTPVGTEHTAGSADLTDHEMELLGSFLEDPTRLDADGRDGVFRLLARPEVHTLFVDALAVRELIDPPAPAPPSVATRLREMIPARPVAPFGGVPSRIATTVAFDGSSTKIAAPLAAMAVATLLFMANRAPTLAVADVADDLGRGVLQIGVESRSPLTPVRGEAIVGSADGLLFRLGVSVLDGEAAVRVGHTDEARRLASSIVELLSAAGAESTVTVEARSVGNDLAADGDRSFDTTDELIMTWLATADARRARYQFGKGSEAARFALLAGRPEVAESTLDRGYLAASGDANLSREAVDSLAVLEELVHSRDFSAPSRDRMLGLLGRVMTLAAR